VADPTKLKPLDKKDHLLQVIIEAPAGVRNKFAFEGELVRASHSKSRGKSYGAIAPIKTSAASTLASPLAVRMPISPSFCSRWRFFFAPFY
jgi:hypothetical protein